MSGLALMEVQHGIYGKLHSDGVLMGMIGGVYDVVPQQALLPYVVIGDGRETEIAADQAAISECDLQIQVWTDIGGRKTALAILNRIYALLHLGTLTLTGYQLVLLRCESAATMLAEQGVRVHGTLAVRATVAGS